MSSSVGSRFNRKMFQFQTHLHVKDKTKDFDLKSAKTRLLENKKLYKEILHNAEKLEIEAYQPILERRLPRRDPFRIRTHQDRLQAKHRDSLQNSALKLLQQSPHTNTFLTWKANPPNHCHSNNFFHSKH